MIAVLTRAEGWARHLVPAAVTFLLLVIQLLPWVGWLGQAVPALPLMAVFYWSVRLPALCPPAFAFAIGCLADLLDFMPLGTFGFGFLLLATLIRSRRRRIAEQAFLKLWAVFGLVSVLEMAFLWLAAAALSGTLLPLGQLLLKTASTILFFPVVMKFILLPAERIAREASDV